MTLHLTSCEYAEPEVYLKEMHLDDHGLEATFKGIAVKAFTESAIEDFKASGGINYVEWQVQSAGEGWFTLTMQRKAGKSPGEIAAERLAESQRLARFFLDAWEVAIDGGTWEGCYIEESMINAGLARYEEATEAGENHEAGDMLITLTDAGKAAIKQPKEP